MNYESITVFIHSLSIRAQDNFSQSVSLQARLTCLQQAFIVLLKIPFRYLGGPISPNRLRKSDWVLSTDKVASKLAGWKWRGLSVVR